MNSTDAPARPRRVGVLGGTFDPVHNAHLACASAVAHQLALDEVVFVPAGQPWQKRDRVLSPAEDRYVMTLLATATDPRFSVSRVEVDRPGPTYTRDTLVTLRDQHPGAVLHFILGADAAAQLHTWRYADELTHLATFVAVPRPGHPMPALPDSVVAVDVPPLAISSSDCRLRVRRGAPINYLVPDSVAAYVAKRGLYLGDAEES